MLTRLAELDLLQLVHSSLAWDDKKKERFTRVWCMDKNSTFVAGPPSASRSFLNWHYWLLDQAGSEIQSVDNRLHFQANLLESLLAASTLFKGYPALAGLKPSQCVTWLEELPLTAVYATCLSVPEGEARQNLRDYLETWRKIKPKTNGDDLKERGLLPGPRYKQILSSLRQAWLDGTVRTEREEMELLEKLLTAQPD